MPCSSQMSSFSSTRFECLACVSVFGVDAVVVAETLFRHRLRRDPTRWNKPSGDMALFVLLTPSYRARITDTFFALYRLSPPLALAMCVLTPTVTDTPTNRSTRDQRRLRARALPRPRAYRSLFRHRVVRTCCCRHRLALSVWDDGERDSRWDQECYGCTVL